MGGIIMTKEHIRAAAINAANEIYDREECIEWEHLVFAFRDGAEWRINSVWHDASEKPDKNQLVVFECRKTYGRGYSVNFGENYDLLMNVLLGWAYVIDLLPERK